MVENKLNYRGFFLIELLVGMALLGFFIYLVNKQIYFAHENISRSDISLKNKLHLKNKLQGYQASRADKNYTDNKYANNKYAGKKDGYR